MSEIAFTGEKINRTVAVFWPGVETQMRFRKQKEASHAMGGELVKMGMQDLHLSLLAKLKT